MFKKTKLCTGLVMAFGVLGSATAQQAQQLERVTVTGSNIKRTDTETASPVQVITRQDIERTGKQSIQEVLRSVTADGQGSIPSSFTQRLRLGLGSRLAARPRRQLDAGAGQRPPHDDLRPRRRRLAHVRRPELDPARGGRPGRGPEGRRLGDLRRRRRRRRGQHHPAQELQRRIDRRHLRPVAAQRRRRPAAPSAPSASATSTPTSTTSSSAWRLPSRTTSGRRTAASSARATCVDLDFFDSPTARRGPAWESPRPAPPRPTA